MTKTKKVKKVKVEISVEPEILPIVGTPSIEEKPKLSKFDFEFNNEGLNKLRDKINEIINFVNN